MVLGVAQSQAAKDAWYFHSHQFVILTSWSIKESDTNVAGSGQPFFRSPNLYQSSGLSAIQSSGIELLLLCLLKVAAHNGSGTS